MNIDIMLIINQYAQGLIERDKALDWFHGLSRELKHDVLGQLAYMSIQAGIKNEDGQIAVGLSNLRKTFTPCVMITKGNIRQQLMKIISLPENEYEKSFILLGALLGMADRRRREEVCDKIPGECHHWWHTDLSDLEVIEEVKRKYYEGNL